ncbi:MAG: FAD-binding oxidoreductase, partial [Alicyclobacillaceae bacterium]|nr:FAD-binding oxidoreductase [Alicyclobacillaceae bacterium]
MSVGADRGDERPAIGRRSVVDALADVCDADQIRVVEDAGCVLHNGQHSPVAWVEPQDEHQVADILRLAHASGWTVLPVGAGTQLTGGRCGGPIDIVLSTSRLNRLVEHSPADLVASVQAGVGWSALQSQLAAGGNMLPVDPWLPLSATIGGIAATGVSGPRRALYGTLRDMAIGLRVVCPDGRVVRTGAKVVKNVAGYDLTKLFIGSRGTLGVITELTFKLRPMPLHRETVVLAGDLSALDGIRRLLMASALVPARAEALWGVTLIHI